MRNNKQIEKINIALCGSFRKDVEGLKEIFTKLKDFHFNIISPVSIDIMNEKDGFVFMRGETCFTPENIEKYHLFNIRKADFVWLFAPDGYIGYTALTEIGFAKSIGKKIFSESLLIPKDIQTMAIDTVSTPEDAIHSFNCFGSNKTNYDIKRAFLIKIFWELAINRSIEDYEKVRSLICKLY